MKQTHILKSNVYITGMATVAGAKECEGPLGGKFDIELSDDFYGEKTWEKAESKMQDEAIKKLLLKSETNAKDIDFLLSGDLQGQCCGTSFGVREFGIPFYGQYGACSTMAQGLSIGSLLLDGGHGTMAICGTSSHFASAERQFRVPNEYGGSRPPTAQWTVTGSGFAHISTSMRSNMRISAVTTGRIVDWGETDANDMGGAMAPAATDTLYAHFMNTNTSAKDYSLILTGDLGNFGGSILRDLMEQKGYILGDNYLDCGCIIYDESQDVGSGGSGCACSALVLLAEVLPKMMKGEIKGKVLFIGTGALLSSISSGQGESIPSIAHLVEISTV